MNSKSPQPLFGADPARLARRRSSSLSRTAWRHLAALVAVAGLGSASRAAVATWDAGAGTQDWNTVANWSGDVFPSGAFPDGVATINTATGLFPIISAPSLFTPSDILIGSGAGASGRVDQTGGSVSTGSGNWLIVGVDGGTGTYNMTGGTLTAQDIHMARGTANSTATFNVSGPSTITLGGALVVADGSNNLVTSLGTMNVDSGATMNIENDIVVAFAGAATTIGRLNINAGATVNIASVTERWLIISTWDSSNGHLNVNGGTLNLNANTDIRFSVGSWGPGASNGTSSLTVANGGSINGGATSVIDLNRNADRAVNHSFNLDGGTVTIAQIISGKATGTRALNFNGGTLRPTGSSTSFIGATAVSAANVKAGGAIIDTNGFDITIARALVADAGSPGGGLTKNGAGTLTLGGVNTYLGNTTVNAGTLVLSDNASIKFAVGASGVSSKLTGTGSVTLDGDFEFDLSGAATTIGSSWQIVDTSVSEIYGGTFSVATFALNGANWVKPANGAFYEFNPATGILRVIADPGLSYPDPVVNLGPSRPSYPLGGSFVLGVTATGTGNLSYQWFYQANVLATPTAISGATTNSIEVTDAEVSDGGIYSVTVSDDAATASSQPPTTTTVAFPEISILPGSSFGLAYYRFENGTNGVATSVVTDSIGSNNLQTLGAPLYSSTSLPYAIIPRTGAANTLGVAFPGSGNHGLYADNTGTLGTNEFQDFTIEAFVRMTSLSGWQTIVGRDDSGNPGQAAGPTGLFYLSKAGAAVGSGANNGFRVELVDKSLVALQVNSTFVPTLNEWYHVAVVGDSGRGTITLYVNGNSVGSTTGYTGLFVPESGTDTSWTLGRGDYNGGDVDFLRGDLDEVRFSSAALPPKQFLVSTDAGTVLPPVLTTRPVSQTLRVGQSTTLTVATTEPGMTYEWYLNDELLPSATSAELVLSNVTTGNSGTYRVKVINPIGTSIGAEVATSATAVVRVLDVALGGRSIGLNFVGAAPAGSFSTASGALSPTATAGFVPAAMWNNSGLGVATQAAPVLLSENSGSSGFTTAVWNSANTWSARTGTGDPTAGEKTPDAQLLHGYIESRSTSGATVSLTNIPFGSYDVYVYVAGGGTAPVGSVSINRAGSPTYFYRLLQHDAYVPATTPTSVSPYTLPFVIADSTTREAALTAPQATFARFTNVSGADLTISAIDSVLNSNAGGIAAVQIVDTTPAGTAYPPLVTSSPISQLVKAGSSVSFSVSAVAGNAGGALSYAWTKGGNPVAGGNSSTLTLPSVSGTDSGTYTVTVTESSSLGSSSVVKTVDLVVVGATRALLINGDLGVTTASNMPYTGVLVENGSISTANVGSGSNSWNNIAVGAGTGSGALSVESTGLVIPGVSVSYSGVAGSLDNLNFNDGAIDVSEGGLGAAGSGTPILRDFAYTDDQVTPMTFTVGGLQSLAGHVVQLVVYAVGTSSTFNSVSNPNDAATITLAAANNHTSAAPLATANADGRDLRYNTQAFVAFEGVVAADGTVTFTAGADVDGGRIPVTAFQLRVTDIYLGPDAPTGLTATATTGQIDLAWTAPAAGAAPTSYTISRGTASGVHTVLSSGTVTGTSYSDTTVVAGTTYYYIVQSANAFAASSASNEASATAASSLSLLEQWRLANFGSSSNTGEGADSADFDKDGVSNIVEYGVGSNPLFAEASNGVRLGTSGTSVTLTFDHIADPSLVYTIEATSDLAGTWTTVNTYPAFNAAGTETYVDSVNVTQAPGRRFLRLRVESVVP